MILDDDRVERFSRQLLLDEVGGRGQERLCDTAVAVAGDDAAASFAATLLAAAGLRVSCAPGPVGGVEIVVDERAGVRARYDARGGDVVTLAGRPCRRCAPAPTTPEAAAGDAEPAVAQSIGALAAAEALRVALGLATAGRIHTLDFARGVFAARPLAETAGCPSCRHA